MYASMEQKETEESCRQSSADVWPIYHHSGGQVGTSEVVGGSPAAFGTASLVQVVVAGTGTVQPLL